MDNQHNNKFIVSFHPNKPIERPLISEYTNIVNISYGKVPMNVTSIIGHHVTMQFPKPCTYLKK